MPPPSTAPGFPVRARPGQRRAEDDGCAASADALGVALEHCGWAAERCHVLDIAFNRRRRRRNRRGRAVQPRPTDRRRGREQRPDARAVSQHQPAPAEWELPPEEHQRIVADDVPGERRRVGGRAHRQRRGGRGETVRDDRPGRAAQTAHRLRVPSQVEHAAGGDGQRRRRRQAVVAIDRQRPAGESSLECCTRRAAVGQRAGADERCAAGVDGRPPIQPPVSSEPVPLGVTAGLAGARFRMVAPLPKTSCPPAPSICSVPALMVVGPQPVLLPEKTSVPLPGQTVVPPRETAIADLQRAAVHGRRAARRARLQRVAGGTRRTMDRRRPFAGGSGRDGRRDRTARGLLGRKRGARRLFLLRRGNGRLSSSRQRAAGPRRFS